MSGGVSVEATHAAGRSGTRLATRKKDGMMIAGLTAARTLALCLLLAAPPAMASAETVCPTLRWTTLGTAGGPVGTPERSEPANMLEAGDRTVLVDTGDGTAQQLTRIGVPLGRISAIFISHHHMDHTAGLAAVIGLRWMNDFPGTLTIYGPPGTREMVDGVLQTMMPQSRIGPGGGFPLKPPAGTVTVVEIKGGDTVTLGDLTVRTVENSHFSYPGSKAPLAGQSLSLRFDWGGRSIGYTGDTGPSDAADVLFQASDMLVSEVVEPDRLIAAIASQRGPDAARFLPALRDHMITHHLTGEQVGLMASKAKVGQVVLTHFAVPPGPFEPSEKSILAGIAMHYAGKVDVASDLSRFEVKCR